ncbi:vomeronasal type-1 receptor 90-like [Ictidomys tridecemlineatus]
MDRPLINLYQLVTDLHLMSTQSPCCGDKVSAARNPMVSSITNVFLNLFHVLTLLLQCRTRPTDVAIAHLALIHLLMCIIRTHLDLGILGFQNFWNNITCKDFIYMYRLMRSLLVSTACLLSVLQATTLSPRSSFLAKSKHTSPQCSVWTLLTLWVFNVFFNVHILVSMGGPYNDTAAFQFVSESCNVAPTGNHFRIFFSLMGIL